MLVVALGAVLALALSAAQPPSPRHHRRCRTLPVVALNQYAVPVDGIGMFTSDWGEVDRARTLCGSDTDRNAPCAPDQAEAVVHDGLVTITGRPIGGRIAPGDITLTGRDRGAAVVRRLRVGDHVDVEYALVPASGHEPFSAVGGSPCCATASRSPAWTTASARRAAPWASTRADGT